MKRYSNIFVLLVILLYSFVNCDISLHGAKCGQKLCQRGEYCSSFHQSCDPCSDICDESNHNFDQTICEKQCQGKWKNQNCLI